MSNKIKRLYCKIQHIWMHLKCVWTHGNIVQTTDLILWIVPGTCLRSLQFVAVHFTFLFFPFFPFFFFLFSFLFSSLFLTCWFILLSITILLLSLKFLPALREVSVARYQDAHVELSLAWHCASLLHCWFFVLACCHVFVDRHSEVLWEAWKTASAVMRLWLSFVLTVTAMFSCASTVQYAVWLYTLYFTLPVGSITVFFIKSIYIVVTSHYLKSATSTCQCRDC